MPPPEDKHSTSAKKLTINASLDGNSGGIPPLSYSGLNGQSPAASKNGAPGAVASSTPNPFQFGFDSISPTAMDRNEFWSSSRPVSSEISANLNQLKSQDMTTKMTDSFGSLSMDSNNSSLNYSNGNGGVSRPLSQPGNTKVSYDPSSRIKNMQFDNQSYLMNRPLPEDTTNMYSSKLQMFESEFQYPQNGELYNIFDEKYDPMHTGIYTRSGHNSSKSFGTDDPAKSPRSESRSSNRMPRDSSSDAADHNSYYPYDAHRSLGSQYGNGYNRPLSYHSNYSTGGNYDNNYPHDRSFHNGMYASHDTDDDHDRNRPASASYASIDNVTPVISGFDGFVYKVQFKRSHRNFLRSAALEKPIRIGDFVIVEADRGEDLGIVCDIQSMPTFFREGGSLFAKDSKVTSYGDKRNGVKHIIRHALPQEYSLLPVKLAEEDRIIEICRDQCRVYSLPMHVVDVEYQYDRHKLTIYFESNSRRIDFRELVRDLFAIYKTRIWMEAVNHGFRPLEVFARAMATGAVSMPAPPSVTTSNAALSVPYSPHDVPVVPRAPSGNNMGTDAIIPDTFYQQQKQNQYQQQELLRQRQQQEKLSRVPSLVKPPTHQSPSAPSSYPSQGQYWQQQS